MTKWQHLLRLMAQHFNNTELSQLCFFLGIDPDELGGENTPKSKRIQFLIRYFVQNNRFPELLQQLQDERPHANWPQDVPELPPLELPAIPIPMMRPERAEYFTGREKELQKLLDDLQPGAVVTLTGPGGIGKSALAAEAIWILAPTDEPPERFPDGVVMHSFYDENKAETALANIARAFGLDPRQGGPQDAARRALAGKRVLLLLDGTEDADDLLAVLAVRDRCGVIVTSRLHSDTVSHEAQQSMLPLPPAQAISLLQAWGKQWVRSADIAGQICDLVGGLPLAVRLVGRYLFENSQYASEYLDWLQETPLAALNHGDRRLQSADVLLARSMAQVSPQARQALGVIGMLAMMPFDRRVIGAALGVSAGASVRLLGELVGYGLLIRPTEQYQVSHALIHTYAREKGKVSEPLVTQLATHYVQFANEQSSLGPTGYKKLDSERPHILMLIERLVKLEQWSLVRQLVWAVGAWDGYLAIQGYWEERMTVLEYGITAAQASSRRYDEMAFNDSLGSVYRNLGRVSKSIYFYKRAVDIAKEMGDKKSEGVFKGNLGITYRNLGQVEEAIDFFEQALVIAKESSNRAGEGVYMGNLGITYLDLGQVEKAIDFFEQALVIAREIGDRATEGGHIGNLGNAYKDLGQVEKAIDLYEQALVIAREIGDRAGEGRQISNLGNAYEDLGRVKKARTHYRQALAIFKAIKSPYADRIRQAIAKLK